MRLLPALRTALVFTAVGFGATLTIAPSTTYDCQNGESAVVISWSGASGPVQVHVMQPSGPAVTGVRDPSGSVTTGNWVSDGLQFFLVDQSGIVEATATAHVSCGGTAQTLDQGLTGGSYFPLQVGNTWVYRYNNRVVTASYLIWTITGTEVINGMTYYDMSSGGNIVGRYRGDDTGVIHTLTAAGDQVYLDPTASAAQATTYSGPLGTFSGALGLTSYPNSLEMDQSIFVRGIGLANLQAQMLSGSSGGFLDSMDLVEVRLNGVRLSVPTASVSLGIESTDLDLTDQTAPNCPLPCYYVACGLGGPQPDPPGTYRPCVEIRLETTALPIANTVLVQFLDATGTAVYSTAVLSATSGNSFNYIRVPLYTVPASTTPSSAFTLLPTGNYQLVGQAIASGTPIASSSINVRLR
jgi:hypothetical protein